jgi:flagellar FliJ protein
MKSRETLIRLKKFQVDEKRRRVTQIEGMIADFQRMSVDLEREIQTEQDRAGINDPTHFAYPTYAKAAIQRRENLTRSADELRIQLEDAKSLLSEAFEELKKVELRPGTRARRGKRPGAGRHGQYRPDARPAWWCHRLRPLTLIGCTIETPGRKARVFSVQIPRNRRLGGPLGAGYATKLPDCSGVRRDGGSRFGGR